MKSNENKSIKITLCILTILVLILGIAVGYLLMNNKIEESKKQESNIQDSNYTVANINNTNVENSVNTENEKNTTSNENKYNNLKGTYSYKKTDDEGASNIFRLSLADDGTFIYDTSIQNVAGFCGNYIINDSEIVLNKLFSYGSDVGLGTTSGQVKLEINSNGTINDTNKYNGLTISNVTLKKESDKVSYNLRERIKAAIKDNAIYSKN